MPWMVIVVMPLIGICIVLMNLNYQKACDGYRRIIESKQEQIEMLIKALESGPKSMRVIEDLGPDSPFDQDPDYVDMRHKAILMAFETGRTVIGDANGVRFADAEEEQ